MNDNRPPYRPELQPLTDEHALGVLTVWLIIVAAIVVAVAVWLLL